MGKCAYNCSGKSIFFGFFAFLILLVSLTPVYGGGGMDTALSHADKLIIQRDYEEAIKVLTDFIRRNPGKFDLAQSRLRNIYKLHDEFNHTADELIDALLNDPENDEKILALSGKLYSLEQDTSPLLVNFVSRTREISSFNVNRNLLRRVLERGRELIDSGDSVGAMQMYSTGMSIMRREFFESGYGNAIESEVIRETERINSMIASFPQANSQINSLASDLSRMIAAGDMARITSSITRLTPGIVRLTELKNELYAALSSFERILNRLHTNDPDLFDRNHLAFLSVLINGRTNDAVQEGMLGAFDCSWRSSVGSSIDALALFLERANTSALVSFNARDYSAAINALNGMESFYNLSGQFFDRHRQFFRNPQTQSVSILGSSIIRADIPQFVTLRSLNEANNFLRQTANIAQRENIDTTSLTRWQQGLITVNAALTSERQTRNVINRIQNDTGELLTRAFQTNSGIIAYHRVEYITKIITAIQSYRASIQAEEVKSVFRYNTIAHNNLRNTIIAGRSDIERGRRLLEGDRATSEGGVVTFHRYPGEALEVLTAMIGTLTADIESGNTILTRHRQEPPAITSNAEITALNVNYLATVNEAITLRSQGTALAETARIRTTQAEAFRQEAERLYREAQAAYQRQDFGAARDRVQRSSERIISSLEIQASASLSSVWDSQLISLGEAITRAENELIIIEVRNLVNNARVAYFAGNFQAAEDGLTRARSRWRVTNSEDNEEVVYWLGIVRTALSMRSGRVISPTAPLYAEMSQLLSRAQRSYDEGVRHINAGQRSLGVEKFDEARQMTREVRLMFPVNQEAGILELRIEQFLDPTAFNASFEQRLRSAVNGTRQRSLESFADLQNLSEINPRYPNIRSIISQAEIDMGFRPPPPNPADIARSRELTASVNRIIDGNISTLFDSALAQINEAITLNPENAEATHAKDRLLNRMSVPGAIVFSSEDEETYQRAVRELQAGNNLIARALVERLMQNPRNRNITKLVELQMRIQAIL